MQTKLTLRLDADLIEQAKLHAKESGKSLSQMVADYFLQLQRSAQTATPQALPPATRSLRGILGAQGAQGAQNGQAPLPDKQDWLRHLEEKHL